MKLVKKNIRLKTHLGDGVYDTLHPETNSEIVRVGDKNLDETLNEVTAQLAHKAELGELLQVKSQVDLIVTEASSGMTDTGSLELVASRVDIDGYAYNNFSRRIDTSEKIISELEPIALIGDNHINAETFIGKSIQTLNGVIVKLPKGVTLKNNTTYKLVVTLSDGSFPTSSTDVAFHREDNTKIGSVPFNSSIGSPALSETSYLKFTTYSSAGTLNIATIGLVLNDKSYSPFYISYKANKLEELSGLKTTLVGEYANLYDPNSVLLSFFNTTTGVINNTTTNFRMVYVPCHPNEVYTIRKKIGTFFSIGTATTLPTIGGMISNITINHTVESLTITTPANANYIVANVWNANSDTTISADSMLDSLVITPDKGNSYPTNAIYMGDSVIAKEENLAQEIRDKLDLTTTSQWTGKSWVSYGDSVTQAGLWQPYVTNEFGFSTFEKSGIGGTTVSNANPTDYFCQDTRLAKISMKNPNMVLIMGGTNDFGYNVPIGNTNYPFDESTFMGGFCSTIVKMMAKFPNARIIVASPLSGRGSTGGVNMTSPVKNSLVLTTEDYAKAVEEVARFLSVPYIDIFGRTGINQFNRAMYLSDSVHPNEAGQKRMAEVAIGELKLINPIS